LGLSVARDRHYICGARKHHFHSFRTAMQQPPGNLELLLSYLPFVLVVFAAWMLLYKPERERMQRHKELLAALKKNDRVLTTSGIYGTVANVDRDGDRVSLKIDESENVKITVTLASIAKVLGDQATTPPSGA
jgi:preprotein translocase subunit YajC